MTAEVQAPPPAGPPAAGLSSRDAAVRREMVRRLDRAAAEERHWLLYTLLGWEHLLTCAASYYLVEVAHLQYPHRWPYAALWLLQLVAALATVWFVRGRPRREPSILEPVLVRVWAGFLVACIDVAALNSLAALPVFLYLPALATLSCFAFLTLSSLVSPRFLAAAWVMWVTSVLIACLPRYGFLLYGGGWLLVLQTLGVIFWRRRRRFFGVRPAADQPACLVRGTAAQP
jgi:hypothetical protein